MKTVLIVGAFAFISTSWAQTNPPPTVMTQPQISLSPTGGSASTYGSASGQGKLRGCIESVNGKYLLKEKSGKKEVLAGDGQDFASHVGQLVWVNGNSTSGPSTPRTLVVSKLETVSDRCALDPAKTEQAANSKPSPYHK
jgi:hypothetical protein